MNGFLYSTSRAVGRFIFFCTMRLHQLRPELTDRDGGYILALTHLGNLDPFCSCIIIDQPIRWMTRKEFFKFRPVAFILQALGCFAVNRQGVPVSAIRKAIELARDGQVVGICPEGGCAIGKDAAIRGGKIKQGVCSVAIRTQRPIVPCVMLGTRQLNRISPWLPYRRAKLWIAYGDPLMPPTKSTRATRHAMRDQLRETYVQLYAELRDRFAVHDAAAP